MTTLLPVLESIFLNTYDLYLYLLVGLQEENPWINIYQTRLYQPDQRKSGGGGGEGETPQGKKSLWAERGGNFGG